MRLKHLYSVIKSICDQYPANRVNINIPRVLEPAFSPAQTSKFKKVFTLVVIYVYSMTHIIYNIHPSVAIINTYCQWTAQLAAASTLFTEFEKEISVLIIDIDMAFFLADKIYSTRSIQSHTGYFYLS